MRWENQYRKSQAFEACSTVQPTLELF